MDAEIAIRRARAADRPAVERLLRRLWGSATIVSRGRVHDASGLEAFVALDRDREIAGLATFELDRVSCACELVTLDALRRGGGIGSALLARAAQEARARACGRLWLITSNDNLDALRFYQRRGMRLVAVHRGALDEARKRKPLIPEIGEHGIPIHDELELELSLD